MLPIKTCCRVFYIPYSLSLPHVVTKEINSKCSANKAWSKFTLYSLKHTAHQDPYFWGKKLMPAKSWNKGKQSTKKGKKENWLFIWKAEWEVFDLLVHSLNGHNSRGKPWQIHVCSIQAMRSQSQTRDRGLSCSFTPQMVTYLGWARLKPVT